MPRRLLSPLASYNSVYRFSVLPGADGLFYTDNLSVLVVFFVNQHAVSTYLYI
ncbi:MAG: hypothetical protein V7722_03350 [Porticoccus sp.]